MSLTDKLNQLQHYQPSIFWLELAGLLHDIGKLQNSFIEYRKHWQEKGGDDPHECDFLGNTPEEVDALFNNGNFDVLHDLFQKSFTELSKTTSVGKELTFEESIADLVKLHINPPGNSELAQMLKASDGKDSAEDRNNPLLVNEQNEADIVFKSSVFGYETPIPENLDELRKEIHTSLQSLLCNGIKKPTIKLRKEVHRAIREAFSQAVNDTCRPANDIVLWEHSYATATLFKVLIAHFILYEEKILSFPSVRFSLWGVGWDGLGFYSSGQKIGDIVGRKTLIKNLKRKIREKVEWDFSLGNAIYDDDNGVYFIIPEVKEGKGAWVDELVHAVREANKTVTEDELPIFFSKPKNTNLMVPIVTVIEEVKQAMVYPWHLGSEEIRKLKWVGDWQGKTEKEVCPICCKRHMDCDRTICEKCEEIRKLKPAVDDPLELLETVYHSEIVLGNKGQNKEQKGNLALIVARFDLKKWLDGTMLYTTFVKEAHSLDAALKHLGEINDLKPDDQKRIEILQKEGVDYTKFDFDYEKIKSKIDLCQYHNEKEDLAKALLFLFDRHFVELKDVTVPHDWRHIENVLKDLKEMRKDVTLENYLVTKNHSPSRLLRIWNGTRDFFIEQSRLLREKCKDEQGQIRLSVCGDTPEKTILKGEARLSNGQTISVEVVKDGESVILIDRRFDPSINWNKAVFNLTAEEFKKGKQNYSLTVTDVGQADIVRARTITASPDIFLAVVPADKAIEICNLIHENYQKEFGKVYGRLPLSMGVLYFKPQMPMFIVLDGARRMLKNFEILSQTPMQATIHKIDKTSESGKLHISLTAESWKRNIDLSLPYALGNADKDYFHPYFLIQDGKDISNRKSYFETPAGKVVHYLELEEEDKIAFYPNFFDFEFLDSTTRRFDLHIGEKDKRPHIHFGPEGTCPYPLEMLSKIEDLWDVLTNIHGLTDTKLRNIESLWLTKLKEWKVDLTDKESFGFQQWQKLVEATLKKEFGDVNKLVESTLKQKFGDVDEMLRESIYSGLFFDCLELNLRILKKKVKE